MTTKKNQDYTINISIQGKDISTKFEIKTKKKPKMIFIIDDSVAEEIVLSSPKKERVKKGFKGTIHKHIIDKDGLRQCSYCDFKTVNASTLSMHISRIHPTECAREISPHVCEYCGKGFQASTNLRHHVKNHHEVTYHACPVPGCGYLKAKNTTTLANHISARHLRGCYHDDTCLTCNTYIGSSIKYHVAYCSPVSPLYKNKK
jgi:hypothetical protein